MCLHLSNKDFAGHYIFTLPMGVCKIQDTDKTKEQLINELSEVRLENAILKASQSHFNLVENTQQVLAAILENMPNAVIVTDFNGLITHVNKATEKFTQYSRHELLGKPPGILIAKDKSGLIQQKIISCLRRSEKWCGELIQKRKDSSTYTADLEIFPVVKNDGTTVAWASIQHDITEEKKAKLALEEERQRLFSLLDGLPGFVYLQKPDYSIGFSNRYFWERFGKPGKRPCYEILQGRSEPCGSCPTFRVFDFKTPLKWEETQFDGRAYEIYAYPFTDTNNSQLVLVLGIDITDSKLAKEALLKSEERFYKAFNTNPNPMVISTFAEGRILEANDSFLSITGYQRDEVIDRTSTELKFWVTPQDRLKMLQTLNEQDPVLNLDFNFCMKSGEVRFGLLSAEIIELNGQKCLLSNINDITQRRQMEQEMARLDRMHLVGEMAAGIGHEIRNPMTTVRGFLQILQEKKECIKYNEYYELIISELDRANSIITEFLNLAKNKVADLKVQNLNTIVETLHPLLQSDAIRADKCIALELDTIPEVLLDEKEIRQLILNLARNGLEAMSPGGTLHIKTRVNNEEIVLSVQDEGQGIEAGILEKVGTPFFTTKDNGTGLGLAVCYSIASRHNARVEINTCPMGTTFFVHFQIFR